MTIYYRTTDASLHDLSADQFAAMQANGKASSLRLWVPTAPPVPSATQRVAPAPAIVTSTTATQAWALIDKTPAELNAEANASDAPNISGATVINTLTNRIQLDRSGLTAAQKIAALETDVVLLLRIARYFVRTLP